MARLRVALATCSRLPDLLPDDDGLLLAALGDEAVAAVWDDPSVDWAAFDLVVVRSTWDYTDRLEDFLAWARAVPRLANPAPVLAWNTRKTYLRELAGAGVPVVPTTWVSPGEAYTPPQGEHVVKPVVSASARDTARYGSGESSAGQVRALLDAGREVMVQPYLRRIDAEGETALVHVGGAFSHAARKAPVLAPDAPAPDEVEVRGVEPTAAQLALARAALDAVPHDGPLLYARVDVVPGDDGEPVLLELELTEPSLFLGTSAGAAERLAAAVRAQAG